MIRSAGLRDLDTLSSIETACFAEQAWSIGQLREELAGDRRVLVCVDEFGVQGYVSVSIVGEDAELLRVGVGIGSRRQGVASQLLASAFRLASESGATRMLLEVADDNEAALALYRRHGFTDLHRRRGYYRGVDALVMVRELPAPS